MHPIVWVSCKYTVVKCNVCNKEYENKLICKGFKIQQLNYNFIFTVTVTQQ